jgi:hypothetical protein
MVQVLHPTPKQKPSFARSIIGGLAEGAADELKHYAENKGVERQLGINLSGIKDPNSRAQIIADQLKRSRGLANAKAASEIDYSLDGLNKSGYSESNSNIGSKKQDNFPADKIKTSKGERNIPVTKTVLNNEQLIQKAQQNVKAKLERNLPADFNEEFNIVNELNNNARRDNQEIKSKQTEYGNKYVEKLENVMPNADDEIISLFKKKGENGFAEGKTEGEIDEDASKEARIFKNNLSNLDKELPKLFSNKAFDEKNITSIKNKIQPLLDEGLFDTAREALNKAGGYPEQIEKIVSNLGEIPKKIISTYEKQSRPEKSWWESTQENLGNMFDTEYKHQKTPYAPEQMEVIKNNIKDVLTQDPAANLVLLREAYLDKDVEWDEFKDIVNELALKGEIKLNDDQFNQLGSTLDNPPLKGLETILKNLRIF